MRVIAFSFLLLSFFLLPHIVQAEEDCGNADLLVGKRDGTMMHGSNIGTMFYGTGPIGVRQVSFGRNFVLETDSGSNMTICSAGKFFPECLKVADKWEGTIPGQGQVTISVAPDGRILKKSFNCFLPGLGSRDLLMNESLQPGIRKKFFQQVSDCLEAACHEKCFRYAELSNAKQITFSLIFGADSSILPAFQSLEWTTTIPSDERTIRTARLAAILDAVGFYDSSNYLKKSFLQDTVIQTKGMAYRVFENAGAFFGHSDLPQPDGFIREATPVVNTILRTYIKQGRYTEAQSFILDLNGAFSARNRAIGDVGGYQLLAKHLLFLKLPDESAEMEKRAEKVTKEFQAAKRQTDSKTINASIAHVLGEAQVLSESQYTKNEPGQSAKVGAELINGGLLKTGRASCAELHCSDGVILRLFESSLLQVWPKKKRCVLLKGTVIVRQRSRNEDAFEVKTDKLVCAVRSGTVSFQDNSYPLSNSVKVLSGDVKVTECSTGITKTLRPGMQF